jgi:hypothetical protein
MVRLSERIHALNPVRELPTRFEPAIAQMGPLDLKLKSMSEGAPPLLLKGGGFDLIGFAGAPAATR